MSHKYINLRLPLTLYRAIAKAAGNQSPKSTVTREILERLAASLAGSPEGKVRPMRHLRTLIDARNRIMYWEIETEDGTFRFGTAAEAYPALMQALMRDVPIVEAAIAADTDEPIIPTDREAEARVSK